MAIQLLKMIQQVFTMALHTFGLTGDTLSLRSALDRCRRRGLDIGTVIDIGASNGVWSLKARKFFPNADFFLVEAQGDHEPGLKKLKEQYAGIDYIIAAAGDRDGEIYFDASDLFGGVASHTPLEQSSVIVPVRSLDSLINERNLTPPFLLKLDTHGFEVPIFEGARETLRQTALIIVETYNFKLTSDSLRFHEMCSFLESRGFRCIDLCEPMHRPKDKAFWQVDLFFVPADREEFKSNTYE
jgi:FkbM family methyltransferase